MSASEYQVNIVSSAISGLFARSICHPIDTIKAKIQATDNFRNIYDVVKNTYHKEGMKGFFRGLSAVMIGGIPGVCLYMTSYEEAKNRLQRITWISSHPFISYFASGMIAEAICCSIFTPVDVVKERLQVQSNHIQLGFKYKGSFHALSTILREEGIHGIYKGYNATIFSYGPFSAIYFLLYEESKQMIKSTYYSSNRIRDSSSSSTSLLPFYQNLLCASFAASIASFITTPLDFAKLRYQIQRSRLKEYPSTYSLSTHIPLGNTHDSTIKAASSHSLSIVQPVNTSKVLIEPIPYTGLTDALYKLYKQYGIRGMYRGGVIRMLFYTPSTGITMAVYEEIKKILQTKF